MTEPRWNAAVDPVPTATPEDVAEQATAVAPEDAAPESLPAAGMTAAEHDVLEQAHDVAPSQVRTPRPAPLEAEGADVAEQQVEVELDEDDYR